MVSYQCMSDLCYLEIHLLRFISCYCTSVYNKYFSLLVFICPSSQNSSYLANNHHKTLIIKKNLINSFCDILKGRFLLQTLNLLLFQKLQLYRRSKQKKTPIQSKHWKTGIYPGLFYRAIHYHNKKGLVYKVYWVNNLYS